MGLYGTRVKFSSEALELARKCICDLCDTWGIQSQSNSIISNISDVMRKLHDSCLYISNDRMTLCNESLERLKNANEKVVACLNKCLTRNTNLQSELKKTQAKIAQLKSKIDSSENELSHQLSIIRSCRPPYYDEEGNKHDPDGAKKSAAQDAVDRLEREISNLRYELSNERQVEESILRDIEKTQKKINECKACEQKIEISKKQAEKNKKSLQDICSSMQNAGKKLLDIQNTVRGITSTAMGKIEAFNGKINRATGYAESYLMHMDMRYSTYVDTDLDAMSTFADELKKFGTNVDNCSIKFFKNTDVLDSWIDNNREKTDDSVRDCVGQAKGIGEELTGTGAKILEGVSILNDYLSLAK